MGTSIYTKTLRIGQRIHCSLYGGMDGIIYRIEGDQKPLMCQNISSVVVAGGNANLWVVFTGEHKHLSNIPEALARCSCQWQISDEIAPSEEIFEALQAVEDKNIKDIHDKEVKLTEQNIERERIINEFSFLTKHDSKGKYCKAAIGAKNIRKQLSLSFPNCVFKVRSSGSSIDISWIDGPISADVCEITDKYSMGSFDGMTDCYDYDYNNVWSGVFGGAKYVSEHRDYSKEHLEQISNDSGISITFDKFNNVECKDKNDEFWFWDTAKKSSFHNNPNSQKSL